MSEEPLLLACQILGDHLNLNFRRCPHSEVSVENLCFHSQIAFRRVKLEGEWWQNGTFPFLVFYGTEQSPAALIPNRKGGYQLIIPTETKGVEVDKEVQNKIAPEGFLFYRKWQDRSLTLSGLARFVLSKRKHEWGAFLLLLLCATVANGALPVFTGLLFDAIIPGGQEAFLWILGLGSALVAVATLIFSFSKQVVLLRLEGLTDHDLEMAVWLRLLALPVRLFRSHSLSDLYTYTHAIAEVRKLLVSNSVDVLFSFVFGAFYLILMLIYSPFLAAVGMGLSFVQVGILALFFKKGTNRERLLLEREIETNDRTLELVQSLTKARLAGVEDRVLGRWKESFASKLDKESDILSLQSAELIFNHAWSYLSTWAIYLTLAVFIIQGEGGEASLGTWMAFLSAFALFNHVLLDVGHALTPLMTVFPLWDKIKAFTDMEPEEDDTKTFPPCLQGAIAIEHVNFGYQTDQAIVLKNITLVIKPGERVAFVGPSGCGKTTLLKLLLGFEQAGQGNIRFDGIDIQTVHLQSLRNQLGAVLQSGALFDGTIFDNVASGRNIDSTQALEAFEKIGAADFIEGFPMGLHTPLTSGGIALSGGQRQLILLARAVVGNPKILILDEATSALDNQRQRMVLDALKSLSITQVIVAQRIETIQEADRIFVLEKGEVVDEGSYVELKERGAL